MGNTQPVCFWLNKREIARRDMRWAGTWRAKVKKLEIIAINFSEVRWSRKPEQIQKLNWRTDAVKERGEKILFRIFTCMEFQKDNFFCVFVVFCCKTTDKGKFAFYKERKALWCKGLGKTTQVASKFTCFRYSNQNLSLAEILYKSLTGHSPRVARFSRWRLKLLLRVAQLRALNLKYWIISLF